MKVMRAKVFHNGGSQAVRLPKACRFPAGAREVLVHREGGRVVIEACDEWPADFRDCLGAWTEPIPRPRQPRLTDLARRRR